MGKFFGRSEIGFFLGGDVIYFLCLKQGRIEDLQGWQEAVQGGNYNFGNLKDGINVAIIGMVKVLEDVKCDGRFFEKYDVKLKNITFKRH